MATPGEPMTYPPAAYLKVVTEGPDVGQPACESAKVSLKMSEPRPGASDEVAVIGARMGLGVGLGVGDAVAVGLEAAVSPPLDRVADGWLPPVPPLIESITAPAITTAISMPPPATTRAR
jgi:hypothetical protein